MVENINEKTLIPIGIVTTCLVGIIGFVMWLSAVASDARDAKISARENFVSQEEYKKLQTELNLKIFEKLSTLDGKVDVIIKKGIK